MTNQQAAKEAKKRWGDDAYIRGGKSISSPERREQKRNEHKAASEEIDSIDTEIRRRLSELDWYQDLMRRKSDLLKTQRQAESDAMYYRFNVGKSGGVFTTILGYGDTWEEAFSKADKNLRGEQ